METMRALHQAGATRTIGEPSLPPTPEHQPHQESGEVGILREENKQLRELVIELSRIVLKNVVDRH